MASSEVFKKDDITNVLRAAILVTLALKDADTPHDVGYVLGYTSAVTIIAVNLGIRTSDIMSVLDGNHR